MKTEPRYFSITKLNFKQKGMFLCNALSYYFTFRSVLERDGSTADMFPILHEELTYWEIGQELGGN